VTPAETEQAALPPSLAAATEHQPRAALATAAALAASGSGAPRSTSAVGDAIAARVAG